MCPNKDLPAEQCGDMAGEVFFPLIDEAREYVFEASLHHRGESLLHPRLLEFVEYTVRSGIRTKLHTNGMLLNAETARGVVEAGLDYLSFSFDGFTAADYEKIRVGGDFQQVVENIRTLLDIREKMKRKKPLVAVEVIRLSPGQVNPKKLEEFQTFFPRLRPDRLIVKNPHNWAGYLTKSQRKKTFTPCTFPWNALIVLWNGQVSPCPQDFFAEYRLGDIRRNRLLEIWNDEPIRTLRRGLAAGRYADFRACAGCDRLWRDTLWGIPREYLKPLLFRRMP